MKDRLRPALKRNLWLLRTSHLLLGQGQSLLEVLLKVFCKIEDLTTIFIERFGIVPDVGDFVLERVPGFEVGDTCWVFTAMFALDLFLNGGQRHWFLDDFVVLGKGARG